MSKTGTIYGINGPVIYLAGNTGFKMSEMVYVGKEKLVGEVISLDKDCTTIQVYEETSGLKPGEIVEASGEAVSVTLAPGILDNIFDGIERPLERIAENAGAFITRGISVDSLDMEKLWDTKLVVNEGDVLHGGDIYAQVQETRAIVHKCMVPPDLTGTVWRIRQKNLLDSTFCLGYIRKWSRQAKTRRKLEDEAMSFAQKHARDRIRQYRVLRYILTVGTLACIIMGMSGMNIPSPLLFIAAVIFVFLIRYFSRYSDQYAKEQRDLSMLVDQIERISNGELTATTGISQESAYYKYSQKLTNIGQGMEKALETQMKGERMKIDLITNVSHDLKTPLTSIIGYVDLLSRDQTLSAESRDYVTILINKTERLKSIISDLFELAKATSGDAKVDLEEMDMKRLVEQTLGDMADQIEESGFAIRYQCEAVHTRFIGDSSRMYRVVQNVIENALKYSLKGTRIFLRITEADQNIKLEVINTASYEMNFTEEEIMERFARAEKSRTSEGNGLGLSIADSFTKNCGGEFSIRIDGDQFLVTIQFKQHLDVNK